MPGSYCSKRLCCGHNIQDIFQSNVLVRTVGFSSIVSYRIVASYRTTTIAGQYSTTYAFTAHYISHFLQLLRLAQRIPPSSTRHSGYAGYYVVLKLYIYTVGVLMRCLHSNGSVGKFLTVTFCFSLDITGFFFWPKWNSIKLQYCTVVLQTSGYWNGIGKQYPSSLGTRKTTHTHVNTDFGLFAMAPPRH